MDLFSGLEFKDFLSPLSIAFSAMVAIVVAKFNVNSQRRIARTRATSDIITKIETDKDIIKAEGTFKTLRADNFKNLIEGNSSAQEEIDIITFLNMYENIFLGVSMDVYDELLIFRYKRGAVLQHWLDVKGLVECWRKEDDNTRLYEMFELFVNSWNQNGFVTRWRPFPAYYLQSPKSKIVMQDNWL